MKRFACVLFFVGADGHAQVYEPPSRACGGLTVGTPNCAGGCCLWFNNGAFIGCKKASGTDSVSKEDCPTPAEPTIPFQDPKLGTIFVDEAHNCLLRPLECAGMMM